MKVLVNLSRLLMDVPVFLWKFAEALLRINPSRLAAYLRRRIYQTECFIDTAVFVSNPHNFRAGKETSLYHGCYILNPDGLFIMGARSHLGAFCYVNVSQGEIRLGEDVAVGPGTKFFAYSNHYETGKKVTDVRVVKNITIGNNVFIGANCSILPGVVVHDHVIVGAGSVVIGELEANGIYAGVPCRKLSEGWYE